MATKDVFSDAVMQQLLELHACIMSAHHRVLLSASPVAAMGAMGDSTMPPQCSLAMPPTVEPPAGDRSDSQVMENGLDFGFVPTRTTVSERDRQGSQQSIEFALHNTWQCESLTICSNIRTRDARPPEKLKNSSMTLEGELLARGQTKLDQMTGKCCRRYLVHPNSKKRLVWDIFGLLLICYDIIVLPLQVFEMSQTLFFMAMETATILFWTMDLPSCFFVGYHTLGGSLIMNARDIAKRYMMTWFPLDLFLVSIDWIILIVDGEAEGKESASYESIGLARLGKTVRVMRLLRMLRLMRLAKIPKYFLQIEEHIRSEYAVVVIGILKLTACILVINHLIACLWYAIGTMDGQSDTWVKAAGFGSHVSVFFLYTTSLHWSLTQFTPASMEIFPQNVTERSFALVVLIFALITFSSFVSSITNAMTHLRNMNSEYAKQFVQLGRYLRFHKISTPLAVRVRRHLARTIMQRQQRLEESEVTLLKLLSEPLLMDLRLEVFRPLLEHHPFFQRYFERNAAAARKLCHTAIVEISLASGDLLFSPGETCDRMYFVKTGTLRYTLDHSLPQPGDWHELSETDIPVQANEWICEACLWTPWRHCGYMHAFAGTMLVGLEAEKFFDVARRTRTSAMSPARYGEHFVHFLSGMPVRHLTDLHSYGFDWADALERSCAASFDTDAMVAAAFSMSTREEVRRTITISTLNDSVRRDSQGKDSSQEALPCKAVL